MRDGGGEAGIDLAVLEGVRDLPDRLVRMGQVVVRGSAVRLQPEGAVVEGDGGGPATLAAPGRGRLLRVPAQQPQLDVVHVRGQRVVEGFLVGHMARNVG
jgi:hypothetical protein